MKMNVIQKVNVDRDVGVGQWVRQNVTVLTASIGSKQTCAYLKYSTQDTGFEILLVVYWYLANTCFYLSMYLSPAQSMELGIARLQGKAEPMVDLKASDQTQDRKQGTSKTQSSNANNIPYG